MTVTLKALGAARNVTGSAYLLETDHARVLVDCGLFQERKLQNRNWAPFPVKPSSIDAVFLTHAHLDHCGLLPKLVREGFRGRIHATQATAELARIILLDSAHLQEEDAAYKAKRHRREGRKGPHPEVPLYTTKDAEATLPLFSPVEYHQCVGTADGLEACFYDAGHVLGSSMIRLNIKEKGRQCQIIFTGDMGEPDRPIVDDPAIFHHADYVVIESTYGNRLHPEAAEIDGELRDVIRDTVARGGNVVVPAFALERTQEILYYMNKLRMSDQIQPLDVYLDSPMAISITEVFKQHQDLFDAEMQRLCHADCSPFDYPGLRMTRTTEESKSINFLKQPVMIIAGSGMVTGGRVKHHIANNITRRDSTILFVGYQAEGTLGRIIMEGADRIRLFGQQFPVRAQIAQIHGFSAHADRDTLFQWLGHLEQPRRVFVTHGEEKAALGFADYIREQKGWDAYAPQFREEIRLI